MKVARHSKQQIPESLRQDLLAFRRRLWWIKVFEAIAATLIIALVGYLLTFGLDRLIETPGWVRALLLTIAIAGCALIPLAIHRWVVRRHRMDQLARLLAQTRPSAGDRLLGVIELSEDASEQARSPKLVEAAIRQVSGEIAQEDLRDAIPKPRHRQRAIVTSALCGLCLILLVLTAAAARNAWARYVSPWSDIPRYTFAAVKSLPEQVVVPHGEPFELAVGLEETSQWEPSTAQVDLVGKTTQNAPMVQRQYRFDLPPQIEPIELTLKVGDYRGSTTIQPMLRPELKSLRAEVALPEYLGRTELETRDVRGSTMTVVKGSEAKLVATASRPLAAARINGIASVPSEDQFSTEPITVDDRADIAMEWEDRFGLGGEKPFELSIEGIDDEPPTLVCENLPRRKVILDSEVLKFKVRARDDYGIKRVGIEWRTVEDESDGAESGESIIGAGGQESDSLQLVATFSASEYEIQPQTIAMRVYAEDYLPNRKRVYAPECLLEVLDSAQHALWISSQLNRWHQMSLDARDREMQLYQTNKTLRNLPLGELSKQQNLDKLSQQAERERAGGRQLASLVRGGERLLKEAMRNPDINADQLNTWAEMMQVLKDIAGNRMPSVADLLKQASDAQSAAGKGAKDGRNVGENRLTSQGSGDSKPGEAESDAERKVMSVTDVESTHNQPDANKPDDSESQAKAEQSRLSLPSTMLAGTGKKTSQSPSADEKMDQAVEEQKELLAEFDKVAEELGKILANLEGSTLVKRLKASSRQQQQIAARLAALVGSSFGIPDRDKEPNAQDFSTLADLEMQGSQLASVIMDDMDAFFQRSRVERFGNVLNQMRESDVTGQLRQLGDELRKENGLSISQAEFWSDTLDRWAEDLVPAADTAKPPGGKAKRSLPPAIVLEVLQILEAQVNLREQTRVAEQARPAVTDFVHLVKANALAGSQDKLRKRMDRVVVQLMAEPEAEENFGNEMGMLAQVTRLMAESKTILSTPDTGQAAIAVQTEIIELLLQSKRFSPSGGEGGGDTAGSGGKGETETEALALVGAGVNEKEVREEQSAVQSTGTSESGYPLEFRDGLDQYFQRLEKWQTK